MPHIKNVKPYTVCKYYLLVIAGKPAVKFIQAISTEWIKLLLSSFFYWNNYPIF